MDAKAVLDMGPQLAQGRKEFLGDAGRTAGHGMPGLAGAAGGPAMPVFTGLKGEVRGAVRLSPALNIGVICYRWQICKPGGTALALRPDG
jgi:hypothetical protein